MYDVFYKGYLCLFLKACNCFHSDSFINEIVRKHIANCFENWVSLVPRRQLWRSSLNKEFVEKKIKEIFLCTILSLKFANQATLEVYIYPADGEALQYFRDNYTNVWINAVVSDSRGRIGSSSTRYRKS